MKEIDEEGCAEVHRTKKKRGRPPVFEEEQIQEMQKEIHSCDITLRSKTLIELKAFLDKKRSMFLLKKNKNIFGINPPSNNTYKKYCGMYRGNFIAAN